MLVQEIVCKNVLGVHSYKAHNKTPNSFSAGFLVHLSSLCFSYLRMQRSVDKKTMDTSSFLPGSPWISMLCHSDIF